jgi:hypothetical protein
MIGHCVLENQKNQEQVNKFSIGYFKMVLNNFNSLCNLTKQVKMYKMADMWLCLVLAGVILSICGVVVVFQKNHATQNYQLVVNVNQEDIYVFTHL